VYSAGSACGPPLEAWLDGLSKLMLATVASLRC